MSQLTHFLTLRDLSPDELHACIARAITLKQEHKSGVFNNSLQGKIMTMIFEKSSTRTRLSFEAGMLQLGGEAIFLANKDSQLGRNEPIADTVKVVSSMTDVIMMRTMGHDRITELARHSTVPVINGLTDDFHPCQLLADAMTIVECKQQLQGLKVAWFGDCFNLFNTWVEAAVLFDFELHYCCPDNYQPKPAFVDYAGSRVKRCTDKTATARDADVVTTDVWTSMGQEADNAIRIQDLSDYQVNATIMQAAKSDAIFLHCLPCHREEEVTAEVIDGPQSVVFQEAENRLHAQKALIEYLLLQK